MTVTQDRQDTMPSPATRKRLALALLCAAWFVGALDGSIVTVALPAIGHDLGLSAGGLQWVLVSYSLVAGGLLLLGGRAGDLFGHRRFFLAGLALFALTSLLGGLAAAPWMLIAARVAQGLGAAAFTPAALALVTSIFEEGPERDRAVGALSAMGALGFATGVVLGGVLTYLLGWRWVMFAALPIALPVLLLTPSVIVERRDPAARRTLDLPGAATVTLGLAALLYALPEAGDSGWTSLATLGPVILGVGLLAGFVVIEQHAPAPLVPLTTFRVRPVAVANAANMLHATSAASTYVLMLYLQEVLGRSPLEASLIYLPLPIPGAGVAPVAGRLVDRLGGARPTIILGMATTAAGGLLIALVLAGGELAVVIAGGMIAAVGRVIAIVALTVAATSGLGEDRQGLAAGLLGTSGQLGAAWGLGIIGAVVAAQTSAPGGDWPGAEALVEGLRWGLLIGVVFVALAILIVMVGLQGRGPRPEKAVDDGHSRP